MDDEVETESAVSEKEVQELMKELRLRDQPTNSSVNYPQRHVVSDGSNSQPLSSVPGSEDPSCYDTARQSGSSAQTNSDPVPSASRTGEALSDPSRSGESLELSSAAVADGPHPAHVQSMYPSTGGGDLSGKSFLPSPSISTESSPMPSGTMGLPPDGEAVDLRSTNFDDESFTSAIPQTSSEGHDAVSDLPSRSAYPQDQSRSYFQSEGGQGTPYAPLNEDGLWPVIATRRSSTAGPSSPTTSSGSSLGPQGTVRGRPRGATVGAVPSTSYNARYSSLPHHRVPQQKRTRPSSLLSHELAVPYSSESSRMRSSSGTETSSKTVDDTELAGNTTAGASSSRGGSSVSRRTSLSTGLGGGLESSYSTNLSVPGAIDSERHANRSGSASEEVALPSEERRPPTTRSRSGSTASVLLQQVQYPPKSHASFVIAVVGHRGAGKSTVIRKGLKQFGLSKPHVLSEKVTSHSTVCIVDREQRSIEVLEIDTSVLLNGPSKRFSWPKFLPHIDAVIVCYDASQITSFRGMSELLENFEISKLCTVMLACKSEIVPKAVDPYYASDMAAVHNVGLAECSVQSEEGKKRMRDCFSYLVKEVAKARASRKGSIAMDSDASRSESTQAVAPGTESLQREQSGSSHSALGRPDGSPRFPSSATESSEAGSRNVSDATTKSETSFSAPVPDPSPEFENGPPQQTITRPQLGLQSAKSAGGYVTLEELWDKLFFAAVTGTDDRFLLMFMVFYRGFVRPIELLRQMISRFESLAQREQKDSLIRYSLLRLAAMLGDWMQDYPGDLSGPETYPLLCSFFERLCAHSMAVHIVAPLRPHLEIIRNAPDLDAAWSKDQDSSRPKSIAADVPPIRPPLPAETSPQLSQNEITRIADANRARSNSDTSSSGIMSDTSALSEGAQSAPVLGSAVDAAEVPEEASNGRARSQSNYTGPSWAAGDQRGAAPASTHPITPMTALSTQPAESTDARNSGRTSETASSSAASTASTNARSPPMDAHRQKIILRATSNTLAEVDDAAIAAELTRLEWQLFKAIRPRDLLRHILVAREARGTAGPVAQSIAHFNYVSFWVCSMILVQSKVKHRARMVEKFMNIAAILRHDNNYNSLQAILAGLGNSAVHRLRHTREQLNGKPVNKTYQSLARLMGSDRSFAAYRLALENSDGRTIPYLGVHLQDLLSMSDGNPSKRAVDNMVHWRKFSLMDEAVGVIVHCQQWEGSPLVTNASMERLVKDLPVMDEDHLYQRSLVVEPRSAQSSSSLPSKLLSKFNATSGSSSTSGSGGGGGNNSGGGVVSNSIVTHT